MRGLLGRDELPRGEGIILRPAGSIHTFFMRFPIDVVFLDRDDRVVDVEPELVPWRTAKRSGAKTVIELPAGTTAEVGLQPGEQLSWTA
jgi:hypothetical protein